MKAPNESSRSTSESTASSPPSVIGSMTRSSRSPPCFKAVSKSRLTFDSGRTSAARRNFSVILHLEENLGRGMDAFRRSGGADDVVVANEREYRRRCDGGMTGQEHVGFERHGFVRPDERPLDQVVALAMGEYSGFGMRAARAHELVMRCRQIGAGDAGPEPVDGRSLSLQNYSEGVLHLTRGPAEDDLSGELAVVAECVRHLDQDREGVPFLQDPVLSTPRARKRRLAARRRTAQHRAVDRASQAQFVFGQSQQFDLAHTGPNGIEDLCENLVLETARLPQAVQFRRPLDCLQ